MKLIECPACGARVSPSTSGTCPMCQCALEPLAHAATGNERAGRRSGSEVAGIAAAAAKYAILVPLLLLMAVLLTRLAERVSGSETLKYLAFSIIAISRPVVPVAMLVSLCALVVGLVRRSAHTAVLGLIALVFNLLFVRLVFMIWQLTRGG